MDKLESHQNILDSRGEILFLQFTAFSHYCFLAIKKHFFEDFIQQVTEWLCLLSSSVTKKKLLKL